MVGDVSVEKTPTSATAWP